MPQKNGSWRSLVEDRQHDLVVNNSLYSIAELYLRDKAYFAQDELSPLTLR